MRRVKQNWKPRVPSTTHDRQGSVIIVVIALLSSLMILGFFLFSLADQENENAAYFLQSAKNIDTDAIDPDYYFNTFLRQFIIGPNQNEYNSALYGGHMSLMTTMMGTDMNPYNGEGVNPVWTNNPAFATAVDGMGNPLPLPATDYEHNGNPSFATPGEDYMMQLNWSPAAVDNNPNDGTRAYSLGDNTDNRLLPQKDVNYSYPDHNSPFLTYYGYAPILQRNNGAILGYEPVLIPAFHRPALLRNLPSQADPTTDVASANWYEDEATKERVLRPHKRHDAIVENGSGLPVSSGVRRFVSDLSPDADLASYPFAVDEGLWSDAGAGSALQYEADPTGRGLNDAVYLDLGLPLQVDPETGTEYVALVAPTILDAEAYVNLNVAGNNPYHLENTNITTAPLGNNDFLTQSNTGYSRSEINPGWILNGLPQAGATNEFSGTPAELSNALEDYRLTFGHDPTTRTEMSNMEMFRLLHGAAQFSSGATVPTSAADIVGYYRGRWAGEAEEGRIDNGINSKSSLAWPWPGFSAGPGIDDNANNDFGDGFGYPFDNFGTGGVSQGTNFGKNRNLLSLNRFRYPTFANQIVHPTSQYNVLDNNAPFSNQLLPGKFARSPYLENEPEETQVDPRYEVSQDTNPANRVDSIFGPGESAGLQLTSTDLTVWGISTRLQELASFNFRSSEREEEIRSRLTTLSSKLHSHVATAYEFTPSAVSRQNDYNADRDSDGVREFPPIVPGINWNKEIVSMLPPAPYQPIREEVQELLHSELYEQDYRKLRRRLSVNHIVDRDPTNNGKLRYRPLTPHTSGLGAQRVREALGETVDGSGNFNSSSALNAAKRLDPLTQITTAAQREWFARWDRQRLARDIYTLLYALGGTDPGNMIYGTSNLLSRTPVPYTDQELRRMAQFAVNMVDHMDSDNVVTVFEYDTDLSDGWGLDDDAHSSTAGSGDVQIGQRQEVYGVEKMELTFSEGLAVYAPATEDNNDPGTPKDTADHEGTEWNDEYDHHFLFMELQNSGNTQISFNNEQWQVVVRPLYWETTASPTRTDRNQTVGQSAGEERRLTLRSGAPSVGVGGPNAFLTIGTVGGIDDMGGTTLPDPKLPPGGVSSPWTTSTEDAGPASLTVRPNFQQASDTIQKIAPEIPLTSGRYLDLLVDETNYRINEAGGANAYEDGTELLPNSSTEPTGRRLLEFTGTPDFSTNTYEVEVVLRRRAHPNRTAPDQTSAEESRDNPWIVADRFRMPLRQFDLQHDETDASVIQGQLTNLRSWSRWQPMYGNPVNDAFAEEYDSTTFQGNTLGNYNEGRDATNTVPDPYTLWQPHNDRFFSSLAEVFSVPLYGPDRLNDVQVAEDNGSDDFWRGPTVNLGQIPSAGTDGRTAIPNDEQTFGHVVLNPDEDTPDDGTIENLWFRALEFLTVPGMQGLGGYSYELGESFNGPDNVDNDIYREFGPININTVRDPEVYAAMLDETQVMALNNINRATEPLALLQDVNHNANGNDPLRRNWWVSHLLNRDIADPLHVNVGTQLLCVPGIPGISRPYRALSDIGGVSVNNQADAVNNSVLRKNTVPDVSLTNLVTREDRQQFELGRVADHDNDSVDYAMRNGLLGKVMNHHTTTSNTFFVFLQVDFFEAKEVASDVVRIGDKLTNSPAFRGFFVVDRAQALEILENSDLPQLNTSTNKFLLHYNQNFNWRALIRHRQRLN